MNKAYPERINWEDEPSIATPLGARNLNKIDYATYEMDNRIIALDANKANQSDLLLDIKSVAYNPTTGVWTFTHQNGTTDTFDQNIEKIPVSFAMDENGVITMTAEDGTTYTCDVGTLIKTITFVNSGNIQFTVTTDAQGNKSVTANIIDGSVTRAKLDPNLLSQIDVAVASASASAESAGISANTASSKALDSEAYAIGTRGGVPVTSDDPAYENNSKYYAEHGASSLVGLTDTNISSPTDKQALVYDEESEKWVNADIEALPSTTITYSEFLQMSDAQQLAFTGYVEDYASSGVPFLNLVSWSTGTDEEITAMVNAFYNNEITLDDIKSVWHVGDSRTITLSSMSATGVGESHRSQDVEMVILDFEHDDLTTAINGHTKSLVSLQQKDCLRDATVSDTDGANNTEKGYINSTNTNVGGWKSSARRTWCNSVYYNALPSAFKSLVKSVTKQTTEGSQSTTLENTEDYVWLPSEYEIYGTKTHSGANEGTQYKHYETTNNRYKLPKWNASTLSSVWWQRSPSTADNLKNCACYPYNTYLVSESVGTSNTYGLAPAVCI